ncbi:MAG: ATP-binding protein [Chloroherpetonaceae bacterium]|nr:ATP-binding protein [Chloroherpetonaceae bacterium]
MNHLYELKLESNPQEVHRVEALIKQISAEHHFSQAFLYDVMLLVTEATNNAILHGNKCNPTKNAFLKCLIKDDELFIEVKDEGSGFDPNNLPDPLAEENLLKPSGRGVFLMRQFSQEVNYSFSESGTTLKIKVPIQRS